MQSQYDAVIMGAGINGLAIAKALAKKGKSVLVLEKDHIASGASSHSSRLIHGGLRYLEHYEFSLVQEALKDQTYLLQHYPDLVRLRPFYLPLYEESGRPVWMIRLGLWFYSLFAKHGESASEVSTERFLKTFNGIRGDGLKTVFRYYDAKTDDKALTQRVAKEASSMGAEIREQSQVQSIETAEDAINVKVDGIVVKSRLLINATGAWVDEVNKSFALKSSFCIEKLSGIHLVIEGMLVPEPLLLETRTKRIFFIIPEENSTLIGTTERSEEGRVDDIMVNDEDIEYLLQESNRYLKKKLTRADIKEVFIGTRPIIKTKKDKSEMSREYKLDLHQLGKNRVLHVYGGKLTTFPSLARKVLARLGM